MSPGETSSHVVDSPRRLAAILAADIAGYSRLMGIDEEGTHARVKRQRREIIDPTIAEHHGRLIKNTGDGFLAMFDSPLEAVRCAIVIQQSMLGRNTSLPRQQWVQYRIGVNLGDVIVDPEDIYGDGVNIAARLESLAEPGSVYISGGVYEQIKNKLVCGYQSLGDEKLKNITDPVRVYRVLPDPAAVARAKRSKWVRAGVAAGFVAVASVAVWQAWQADGSLPGAEPRAGSTQPPQAPQQAAAPTPPPQAPPQQAATPAPATPAPTAPAPTAPAPPPAATPDPPRAAEAPAEPPPSPPPPAAEAVRVEPPPASPPQQVAVVEPPRPPQRPQATGPYAPFRDCSQCPEMISLPGGSFTMGSHDEPSERPVRQVTVPPFALGRFPVTVGEWKQCVAAKACSYEPRGDDDTPVHNVSWNDAQQYVAFLSKLTQKRYRLPTEAEWEYAARAGAGTRYWWGNQLIAGMANCRGCGDPYDPQLPVKVGSFAPNPFGLYDMTGGVAQWVSDCWHKDYQGAPRDGSSWDAPNCREHVLRGGSWKNDPSYLRAASRDYYDTGVRYLTHGVRVARSP